MLQHRSVLAPKFARNQVVSGVMPRCPPMVSWMLGKQPEQR
jgi:hypothetical protein